MTKSTKTTHLRLVYKPIILLTDRILPITRESIGDFSSCLPYLTQKKQIIRTMP